MSTIATQRMSRGRGSAKEYGRTTLTEDIPKIASPRYLCFSYLHEASVALAQPGAAR